MPGTYCRCVRRVLVASQPRQKWNVTVILWECSGAYTSHPCCPALPKQKANPKPLFARRENTIVRMKTHTVLLPEGCLIGWFHDAQVLLFFTRSPGGVVDIALMPTTSWMTPVLIPPCAALNEDRTLLCESKQNLILKIVERREG